MQLERNISCKKDMINKYTYNHYSLLASNLSCPKPTDDHVIPRYGH